jgi:hypothetical protein
MLPTQFLSLASFLIRVPRPISYDIYISMYVLSVFIGTGNSMVILGKFFSVYLFLISCVECLVICIDSFEFCKSSRRVINRKASCTWYLFSDHFSCFVKNTRRDSYFLTVNLNALCFFEI